MSEAAGGRECGGCAHWRRLPPDPHNLGQGGVGECRCTPPQLVPLPAPGGLVIQALYPRLPERFPACGLHAATGG